MRPIMLTAATASLALIPIAREIFRGPISHAMMGGIIVGTMLTLLFLPALCVAWFRIKEPESATGNNHQNPAAWRLQTDLPADAPYWREMEMHRSCHERGFEFGDVRPRRAVFCDVRDHGKADRNQRNPGGARLLPKGYFRYAGMRLACLRSSVRRRQAIVATWRRRV
jgi:hypothetical protein